ncbi:MAG: AAA family ATPase [Armatimonadetes bacterium]|nr:AAA family ATPase [Armatimonadota bacterium]
MTSLPGIFAAQDAAIAWNEMERTGWWQDMATCQQDPVYHAEGDVATHTRMVVDELRNLPTWQGLTEADRGVLLLAALLHDVGKPATTVTDDAGRITSPGHSRRGAILARQLLYESGVPFAVREAVCALIRWHQRPFWVLESASPERAVITIAQTCRCDYLAVLAEADARGRVSPTLDNALLHIALFAETAKDAVCYAAPYPFASDHSRFLYFRTPDRAPDYAAYDDTAGEIVLMSGLPGAGKDTLVQKEWAHLPVVSLDALRIEHKIAHGGNQHAVISAARELARTYLRRGEPFVWNATSINREQRDPVIALAAEYRYRVRVVYVEAAWHVQQKRNKNRAAPVPDAAIMRMMARWEPPDETEAHTVERWFTG